MSWVLAQTTLCSSFSRPWLSSTLPLGSAIMSENALEQARGRSRCSPGCSGLSLCCRCWERSWQGQVCWRKEDYSLSLTSEPRQTSPTDSAPPLPQQREMQRQPAFPEAWPAEQRAGCQESAG